MVEEKGKQAAGEKNGRKPWTLRELSGKTVWDWLQLIGVLAIPVVLAIGGCMFNAQQDARQQQIEDRRAEAERELAEQRAQDEALQAYLDQMSTLLLENDLGDSPQDSAVRTLAQSRTLTLLDTVDKQRRRNALRFLYEANLVDRPNPVIRLDGANLQSMDLDLVNLSGGNFFLPPEYGGDRGVEIGKPGGEVGGDGADLSGADLSDSSFRYGALVGVDLEGADFSNADLTGCGLSADFTNVAPSDLGQGKTQDLAQGPSRGNVDMSITSFPKLGPRELPKGAVRTNLEGAFFNDADLQYAALPNADLSGADLISANLVLAWLVDADLTNANFANADLRYAQIDRAAMNKHTNFEGADLTGASLRDVVNLDPEQLERQAKSLKDATMPNGQKYEYWLKSKDRKEAEENE